jgi:palmitoyltransferase ZDHHC2/15/20
MVQVNVHSYRPRSLGGYLCLLLSYIPPVIAFGLMILIMLPYCKLYCYDTLWRDLTTATPVSAQPQPSESNTWSPAGSGGNSPRSTVVWFLFCVLGSGYLFGSLLVSFWRCMFTSPGYVPYVPWSEEPHVEGSGAHSGEHPLRRLESTKVQHSVTQLTRAGRPRHCAPCSIYKPDDAHHCHDCGRCVERMDHHCPWINNCVGLETEKYFILFLLYIALTGSFIATTLGVGLKTGGISIYSTVFLIVDLIGSAVFGIAMMGFVIFHLTMLYKGISTIDYVVAKRTGVAVATASAAKRQQVLTLVFGVDRRWWVLLLPIAPKRPYKEHGDTTPLSICGDNEMITIRVGRPDNYGPSQVLFHDHAGGGSLDVDRPEMTSTISAGMEKSYNAVRGGASVLNDMDETPLSSSVRHHLIGNDGDGDEDDQVAGDETSKLSTTPQPVRIKFFHTTL